MGDARQSAHLVAHATFHHAGFGAGPVVFTDAAGQVVEERRIEPFGVPIGDPDLTARDLNPLNKRSDPATGWSDHGARWVAPETARWLTTDPPVEGPASHFMFEPWKLHPYQYVAQNPVVYWDPDGRENIRSEWLDAKRNAEAHYAREHAAAVAKIGGAVPGITRAPTPSDTVTAQAIIDTLDWNQRLTQSKAALFDPFLARQLKSLDKEARAAADRFSIEVIKQHPKFSRNNDADAFRHAYFNLILTREADDRVVAKRWGDAHEVSVPNPISEVAMDLWNNAVGRQLAVDNDTDAYSLVLGAYQQGKLIVQPVGPEGEAHQPPKESFDNYARDSK